MLVNNTILFKVTFVSLVDMDKKCIPVLIGTKTQFHINLWSRVKVLFKMTRKITNPNYLLLLEPKNDGKKRPLGITTIKRPGHTTGTENKLLGYYSKD